MASGVRNAGNAMQEMALGGNRGAEVLSTKDRANLIRACCKVKLFGGGSGSGSLCMIQFGGRDVYCVLTNNHVLCDAKQAASATAEFSNLDDEQACSVSLEPTRLFFTDELLDYTFVAVRKVPQLGKRDVAPVTLGNEALKVEDYVYVVQYPDGGERRDSHASVCDIETNGKYVYYQLDTDYGSSGGARYHPRQYVQPTHLHTGGGRGTRCPYHVDASLYLATWS
jgi:hypothetical protein